MSFSTELRSPLQVDFEKYKLSNGLEVILSEDHRLPVVAINIWYHVGPANERPGRTGFAHLFEHMMFQGSKHVGDNQIKVLQAAGATGVNGTTGFDRTNYFETMPAENLELALWLESDRMAFLLETLTARNLANQRDVVRNERRERENSPYSLVEEELYRQLFPAGHPYHASIIGSHADIEAVRLEDVREFCTQFYVPNNATLALVGDFNRTEAKGLIELYFGSIPAGKTPPKLTFDIPEIRSAKRVIVTDRVELPRVYKAWISPSVYAPGDAATDVLAHVLGRGEASRLYRGLVHESEIAQDVSASNQSLQLGSVFLLRATAKHGVALEDLERGLDEQLLAIRSVGPTQLELDRARNTILSEFVFGLEQVGGNGIADRLNQYNHYTGDPDFFAGDWERYDSLTTADVQRAAQRFTPESSLAVYGVPGPKILVEVPKRKDIEHDSEYLSTLSDHGWRKELPLAKTTARPELPVPISFRLSNGLRVLFLEQHHIPGLALRFVTTIGSGANPPEIPGLSSFTADMMARGTAQRSQAQLASEFGGLGAAWSTWSSPDASGVNLRVLEKNLHPAFELFADLILNPSFTTEEVERLRRERLGSIAQGLDIPRVVAQQEFLRELYGAAHPYGSLEIGTTQAMERITRVDLMSFHSQAFLPAGASLIVAGDASQDEVRRLGEKHFGKPSATSASPAPIPPVTGSRKVLIVDRPGSPQTQLLIGQLGTMRANPDYLTIELMNMILGGMFSSRINHNLREVHGYTYGASSQFGYRRHPGPFTISTAVRTDATADGIKQIFFEIDRMREILPSSEEMSAAREALSRSLISRFDTLASSSVALTEVFAHNLEIDYFQAKLGDVQTVSQSDIHRIANQYLHPSSMIVVAVGDASKIEGEIGRP